MDFIGFVVSSGAAAAAGGAAYIKLAPTRWKDAVKADLKAAPSAALYLLDKKIADMRIDTVVEVQDPATGISLYRNTERDVVDLKHEIKEAERIGENIANNPNRPYPPEWPK